MRELSTDRRKFLRRLAGLGQAGAVASLLRAGPPGILRNPVGYATIAWPDEEFSQALETISKLGFKGVQMLGWVSETYGGSKTTTLRGHLKDMRLRPVTLSCW